MVLRIETGTIRKEEERTRFTRDRRLNPTDRFGYRSELERADTGRGQEWSEDHVVPRRDTNDVVYARIDRFHEPTTGPSRAENHHPWLLVGLGRGESGVPSGLGRRRAEPRE